MVCCRACLPGAWCHRECWLPGLRAPSKWWPLPQTLHMPCTLRPPPQPGTSKRHVHGSCDRWTRAWLTCGVGVVPQEFFDCSNLDMGDLVRLQQWWPRGFSHTLYAHSMVSHVGLGHVCNSRGSGVAAVASLQVPTPGFHGPPHTSARAPSAVRSHGEFHGLLPFPSCHTHGVLMALCTATHSFEPQNLSLLDRRHSQLGVCNSQGQLPTAQMQWMRPSHPCRRSGGVWVSVGATVVAPLTHAVPLVGVVVVAPQQSWLPEALQGDANSSSSVLRAATSTAGDNATERRLRGSTRNQPFRAGGLAPEAGISDTDASDDAAAKRAVELCDQSLFTTDPHSLLKVRSLRSFCDNPNALCAHYHHAVTGVYWPRRSLRAWRQG